MWRQQKTATILTKKIQITSGKLILKKNNDTYNDTVCQQIIRVGYSKIHNDGLVWIFVYTH